MPTSGCSQTLTTESSDFGLSAARVHFAGASAPSILVIETPLETVPSLLLTCEGACYASEAIEESGKGSTFGCTSRPMPLQRFRPGVVHSSTSVIWIADLAGKFFYRTPGMSQRSKSDSLFRWPVAPTGEREAASHPKKATRETRRLNKNVKKLAGNDPTKFS